ncbi:hypothetical protein VNO77_04431 [Canavalia gladiata]|uniref:Uncharacterized protein n=1 Tax=Canavalia gladiata TaxID=3824 RepID=A0AAN9MYJ7_CANGL
MLYKMWGVGPFSWDPGEKKEILQNSYALKTREGRTKVRDVNQETHNIWKDLVKAQGRSRIMSLNGNPGGCDHYTATYGYAFFLYSSTCKSRPCALLGKGAKDVNHVSFPRRGSNRRLSLVVILSLRTTCSWISIPPSGYSPLNRNVHKLIRDTPSHSSSSTHTPCGVQGEASSSNPHPWYKRCWKGVSVVVRS